MITAEQTITIEHIVQIGSYELEITFNDATKKTVDFHPFLSNSLNPLIRKYLNQSEFTKFNIDDGDLKWNDYDLCFPIADLYENRIHPTKTQGVCNAA